MFTPWVGANWETLDQSHDPKILILGESHYEADERHFGKPYANGTLETFDKYVFGNKTLPFFTKVLQTVSGRKKCSMTRDEILAVWNSVAFYNYVPVYVAQGPRVAPTNEMFELGVEPFNKIMSDLQPNIILVCGLRLWWWLLKGQGYIGDPASISVYKISRASAMKMKHPSSAFSSDNWNLALKSHIEVCLRTSSLT